MKRKIRSAVVFSLFLGGFVVNGSVQAGATNSPNPKPLMDESFLEAQLQKFNGVEEARKKERESKSGWNKSGVESLLVSSGVFESIEKLKPIEWTSNGISENALDALLGLTNEPLSSIAPGRSHRSFKMKTFSGGLTNDNSLVWVFNTEKLFTDFEGESASITPSEVRSVAQKSFDSLGLKFPGTPIVNVMPLTSTPMKKTPSGAVVLGETETVAQKAFFSFEIQGVRLNGARATFGYFSDGSLQKASLRWPVVKSSLGTHTSVRRDLIVERVHKSLIQHPLGARGLEKGLRASLELVVKDGKLMRVVSVTGQLFGPDGKLGRFSSLNVEIE